jgi:hypothetical protein
MRHIHADNICIAANDTSIEWQRMSNKDWANVGKSGSFTFFPDSEYRQRPAPHPHQALMDIAAADPDIYWEHRCSSSYDWMDCIPKWIPEYEYRQKPAPHPHQSMMDIANADPSIEWEVLDPVSNKWMLARKYFMRNSQYRQKPAETKMVDMWQWAVRDHGLINSTQYFYHDEAELVGVYNPHQIICRIEGSKISVEVSQ